MHLAVGKQHIVNRKKTENSTYFERNDCKKELSSQGCEALKGRARDSLVLIHIQ